MLNLDSLAKFYAFRDEHAFRCGFDSSCKRVDALEAMAYQWVISDCVHACLTRYTGSHSVRTAPAQGEAQLVKSIYACRVQSVWGLKMLCITSTLAHSRCALLASLQGLPDGTISSLAT
jgi:hypothetical protein